MSMPQPVASLATLTALCREARSRALVDAMEAPALRGMRWRVDREPCMYVIDAEGSRLNDGNWTPWRRRKGDVEALLVEFPDACEIIVDSAIDCSASKDDYDAGNYEPQFWQAIVWKRDGPVHSVDELEAMLRRRTGFGSFGAMFRGTADYRPSCDMSDPEMRAVADHYDALAEQLGDDRRAYRYGGKADVAREQIVDAVGIDDVSVDDEELEAPRP